MLLKFDVVIPRMITDRIGRHELLLPLNKFFRPCAVKTDAFPASFDKSKGLTSCRRQFPEGCFLLSRALIGKLTALKRNGLQGKNALFIAILEKSTLKRSCHSEFLFNQFFSVLPLPCSLLRSLVQVIALISVHDKLRCRIQWNLQQFPRVQRNGLIQRQFYGERKKRFSGAIKGNKHFNHHNFLNFFNTHLNLLRVIFLTI